MAYAAVNSLKRTVERHIIPTNPQITENVYQTLNLLGNFLERARGNAYRNTFRRAVDAFDAELREAVWKLEDAVDSYVLHLSRPPPQGLGPVVDEERLQQEMDSFLEKQQQLSREYMRELEKYGGGEEVEPTDAFGGKKSTAVGSSDRSGSGLDFFSVLETWTKLAKNCIKELETPWADFGGKKSTTVGLSDQFEKIRFRLLNSGYGLDTISLMGMAGIGKTHLARKIYQDPIIDQEFDCRAWVTAGPTAAIEAVLVEILAQIERKPQHLYTGKDRGTLAALLKRKVHGCRFLIVLDDVWSTHISDYLIHHCLEYVHHWSRVLLTTRLEEVAESHPTYSVYPIRFMNNEESWDLLSLNVFGEESFPPELEKAGRKIAEICEGLPLLILAVAEILCGVDKTEEHWNKVAAKKTTTFKDANDRIAKVLYPSYEYLPEHLKACFLYMGVFSESSEVPLSKLVNLMMVEDFLEPSQHGDLQDLSVNSLEELVANSVVLACKKSFDNRLKSCKLHSSFWHLCISEARKSKFLHVLIKLTDASKDYIQGQRRVCVQNNMLFGIKEAHASVAAAALRARSLLFTGEDHQYPVPVCFELMFLKVLDALAIRFYEFPNEVVKLLRLRYLALTYNGKLPPSISNLQQLQCLILRQHHNIKILNNSSTRLPIKIWHMQELAHLRIIGSNLPDPSSSAKLSNLISLHVNAHSCTKAVFRGIPNLRKLGIKIELQPDGGETISCLNSIMILGRLESLKCVVVNPRPRSQVVAPPHHLSNLPKSLQKLSLNGLGYSWKAMSAIGSLPNLKVLKLRCFAFQGEEWETKAGKFVSLEFLLLEDLDVLHLTIHGDKCFPSLRRLIVHHCFKLKMIPRQVGSIRSMEKIEVVDCSPSVVASAMKLKYYGNSFLQVVINSSWSR